MQTMNRHRGSDPARIQHRRRVRAGASGASCRAAAQAAAYDLAADVKRAMATFDVPGIAIAIVKDGKVVAAQGFGVRKLGEPAPVDGKTIFEIASNSKAFTAAALAMLVDEGKLAWDDPVTKHLPDFRMYDAYVTARDDGARPAGPPQRPWPRRGRPAVVADHEVHAPTKSSSACATSSRPPASATATPTTTCCTSSPARSSRRRPARSGATRCASASSSRSA